MPAPSVACSFLPCRVFEEQAALPLVKRRGRFSGMRGPLSSRSGSGRGSWTREKFPRWPVGLGPLDPGVPVRFPWAGKHDPSVPPTPLSQPLVLSCPAVPLPLPCLRVSALYLPQGLARPGLSSVVTVAGARPPGCAVGGVCGARLRRDGPHLSPGARPGFPLHGICLQSSQAELMELCP